MEIPQVFGVKIIGTGKADLSEDVFLTNRQLAKQLRGRKKLHVKNWE